MYEREEEHDHLATPSEAVAEWAHNYGMDHPDRAWLLHDWDVWVANPFYAGPKVPHPEDDYYEGEEAPGFDSPKEPEWTGFDSPEMDHPAEEAPLVCYDDDNIPF